MARIKLALPEKYHFSTEISVRITDVNYGGHLGNDAVLSIIHEARVRFFKNFGFTELNVDGTGIIMADSAIVYKAESFQGDQLEVKVAVTEYSSRGCDIFYLLSRKSDSVEIARAKTGIVFFDYEKKKLAKIPEKFQALFPIP